MTVSLKPYPAYKPSGVEWLGDVPVHWELQTIRAVTELKSEKNRPNQPVLSVYREYGVIPKDSRNDNHNATALDTSTYKAVEVGDLVVNKMKAWQGSMGVSEHDGIVSPAYITCRVNAKKVAPKFLHYLLRSKPCVGVYNSLSYGVRVGQWDMHYEDFKKIVVPLPKIDEQHRIADFLDQKTAEIDEAINKKQRLIELLKEQKAILINQAVTKGLNPNVPMRDSGVEWSGEVPAHWEVKKLKWLAPSITVGIVVTPAKYYVTAGIPCLRSLNIRPKNILAENLVYISERSNEFLSKSKISRGDLVCVRTGQPGTTAVVDERFDGANCIDLIIIRQSPLISSEYLSLVMNSGVCRSQYLLGASGAIQQHFNIETTKNLTVFCPPLDEQHRITAFLDQKSDAINETITKKEHQIARLQEYRTILIADVVTGKLDVREDTHSES